MMLVLFISLEIFVIYKSKAEAAVSLKDVEVVYHRLCVANNGCPNLRIIRSREINSMATKGEIIIFTGMLKFLDNRDQLALVLGHELGHVHNGDPHNFWHTFNMEYHADQYGAYLASKAKFNRCKGVKYFNKTMKYFGDGTSVGHPMNSLRLQRVNYDCNK